MRYYDTMHEGRGTTHRIGPLPNLVSAADRPVLVYLCSPLYSSNLNRVSGDSHHSRTQRPDFRRDFVCRLEAILFLRLNCILHPDVYIWAHHLALPIRRKG